jgi:hypothetical protein
VALPTQLRSWLARATPYERTVTGVTLLAVAGLLVASMVLRPEDAATGAVVDASGSPVAGPEATPGEAAGPLGTTADQGPTEGEGAPGGATTGVDPGQAGGDSGPSLDGGGAVELVASDRGVTKDEVTVGFLLQNPAGLSSTGFSTGQRSDGERYVQALADWAGRDGRLGGRTIRPVLRLTDPTSVEDQAAACRSMVDDAKFFGVIDVAAMLDTASLDCVTNTGKGDTPLVHSVMWSRAWQQRSGGNEVSYQAAIDRISLTWARDLGAMHWFPRGATVGILGDKCPATEPTIVDVLGPALKAQGAGEVVFGNHDCNLTAVVSEPSNIATRFRLAGVTHVLIVSNFAAAQIFMTTADSQGYAPKYSTSDWFLNTSDSTAANFPPDQFDGAVGIASLGSMLPGSGKPPYDGWQECSQIAVDAGLAPIPPGEARSTELLSLCDNFRLFLDALVLAGPNPTRASWRAAVPGLGQRTSAVFGPSRFGADKRTGSDTVHTISWQRGCRCWRSVSDFRAAAA